MKGLQHLIWNASESNAGAMIKIDLKKGFDKMGWPFVRGAPESLGFATPWIRWIMAAVDNLGILINGKASIWIEGKSGLRQGCPLSPFLFVICAEVLTRLIRREEAKGDFRGICLSPSSLPVSHLFFADDLLFFRQAV